MNSNKTYIQIRFYSWCSQLPNNSTQRSILSCTDGQSLFSALEEIISLCFMFTGLLQQEMYCTDETYHNWWSSWRQFVNANQYRLLMEFVLNLHSLMTSHQHSSSRHTLRKPYFISHFSLQHCPKSRRMQKTVSHSWCTCSTKQAFFFFAIQCTEDVWQKENSWSLVRQAWLATASTFWQFLWYCSMLSSHKLQQLNELLGNDVIQESLANANVKRATAVRL